MKYDKLINQIACLLLIVALTAGCKKQDSVGYSGNSNASNNGGNMNTNSNLVLGSNSPVASGTTLNLTASTITGASYYWTGTAGFYSSDQNATRANFVVADAGVYSCTASVGYSQGVTASITVSVK